MTRFRRTLLCLLGLLLAACASTDAQARLPGGAFPTPDLPAGSVPTLPITPPPNLLVWSAASPTPPLGLTLVAPLPAPTRIAEAIASPAPSLTPTPEPLIRLLFTGNIVPARCVQAATDQRGSPDYIYASVREQIQAVDLAVGVLNSSLTDFPPRTGCVSTFILVGASIQADALAAAGFDAVSAATNHIKNCSLSNCGDRAFLDTLENLQRVGVAPIGAGQNLEAALQPVVFTLQGVRFAIISLGEIEANAFAGPQTPGIAVLTPQNLRASIAAARQAGDVVIAMPHWGPEYSPRPNPAQLDYARIAVEAGADLVVGNHTHVVQAIEFIERVPVFYGLGNFVFDQNWSAETQQAVMLVVSFRGARYEGYELIPVVTEGDGAVRYASQAESTAILERIRQASQNLR